LPAFKDAIPIIAKLSKEYILGPKDKYEFDDVMKSDGELCRGILKDFLRDGRQSQCLVTQWVS
jgi:hypothetical protein